MQNLNDDSLSMVNHICDKENAERKRDLGCKHERTSKYSGLAINEAC